MEEEIEKSEVEQELDLDLSEEGEGEAPGDGDDSDIDMIQEVINDNDSSKANTTTTVAETDLGLEGKGEGEAPDVDGDIEMIQEVITENDSASASAKATTATETDLTEEGQGEGKGKAPDGDIDMEQEVINENDSAEADPNAETGVTDEYEYYTDEDGLMMMRDESGQMLSAESLDAIRIQVHQMTREELEEFIMKKVIEAFNANTLIGQLRTKCLHIHGLKDKLFQKSSVLQKQVSELSRAMKVYEENEAAKNPDDPKPNVPLKFFRSVGLQVSAESFPKIPPSRSFTPRMTDSNSNALMKQLTSSPNHHNNQTMMTPSPHLNSSQSSPISNKRQRPMISVNEVRNQVGQPSMIQPQSRQMQRNGSSGSLNVNGNNGNGNIRQPTPILPRTANSGPMATVNGNTGTPTTAGGVIDLTEDKGGAILTQNGVQYRVVNQNGLGQGMQLVSSSTGYHLVSPQGNIRPVVFQQAGTNVRATHPPTQVQGQNRSGGGPITIRSNQGQGQHNRPAQRISNSPNPAQHMSNGISGGRPLAQIAPQPGPSKPDFTLPQLPGPTVPYQQQQRQKGTKEVPPRPELTLMEKDGGIVLSWTHRMDKAKYSEIVSYQIFACQQPLSPSDRDPDPAWKKVGDVKALPLPMACTLSQFSDANRYHFIVRGIDVYNRSGAFCEIVSIVLKKKV